jgi:hypothetical protein
MAPKYETKAKERIRKGIARYTPILKQACEQGANEANTSAIVHGMLAELLGYDRFFELSGEYEVKGRWADWAVRVDGALWFFVEVKPVAAKLRDRDLFQVVAYARQYDIPWAVLTNGHTWQCHRVAGGNDPESFFEVRFLEAEQSLKDAVAQFYLLSKEGFSRGALREAWRESQRLRPDYLASILLSDSVLTEIRRQVQKDHRGRRLDIGEVREALERHVLRGDLVDILRGAESD